MVDRIINRLPEFVVGIVLLYVLIPFLAPISFLYGFDAVGIGINEVYERFCHQRVERSVFLFGNEGAKVHYTVNELKEIGYLPDINPNPTLNTYPQYFGHDYYGDENIGWKVPICIRDIALYGSLALSSLLLLIMYRRKKIVKVQKWVIFALLVPIVIDGLIQVLIAYLALDIFPMWFIDNWERRIITGILAGLAISLFIIPLLVEKE